MDSFNHKMTSYMQSEKNAVSIAAAESTSSAGNQNREEIRVRALEVIAITGLSIQLADTSSNFHSHMKEAIIGFSSSLFYLESQCICSPLIVEQMTVTAQTFLFRALSCRLHYCTCNTYMSERVQGSAVGQGPLCAGEKRVMIALLNLITPTVNSHSIIYL